MGAFARLLALFRHERETAPKSPIELASERLHGARRRLDGDLVDEAVIVSLTNALLPLELIVSQASRSAVAKELAARMPKTGSIIAARERVDEARAWVTAGEVSTALLVGLLGLAHVALIVQGKDARTDALSRGPATRPAPAERGH